MKKIPILPTLFTLGNVFCGLLAMAKAVDGLADPEHFYPKMESACALVFLGMVFDSLDGWVARLTRGFSDFGAQLDSLADALTFGLVPAFLAKVLIEHEGVVSGSPRLHFLAAASYSVMAILRLARFNLENDNEGDHGSFKGLPSPAAGGAVVSLMWLYLVLSRPELEISEGSPTPFGALMGWLTAHDWSAALSWGPTVVVMMLPVLGLLMVSRVPYSHGVKLLTSERAGAFPVLVAFVFCVFLLYLAPVPILFLLFNGYAVFGIARRAVDWWPERNSAKGGASQG